jgi:serine/threonine protein kinase
MSKDAPQDDRTAAQVTTGPADAGVGAEAGHSADASSVPPTPSAAARRQDSGNALPVGTYLDEFELQSVAGEGGFSIVYRAWDHTLNRQVALKEYFPSGMVARSGGTQVVVRSDRHTEAFEAGLRSFVEEARLLAKFDHPALVKVYRFWRANGSAYMVMPFCEGITLREAWRHGAEPPDEAALLQLLDPLTDALAVLHAERWYHRDIAPDNVMLLAGSGRPLLLDFGAARQVIGDLTHALTVILKPGYAPIEQWGEVPGMQQGPWTDVYALGAMIHFAITGATPPPSVGRLINDGFEPLTRVAAGRYSEGFLQAVDHALVVRPEQRTASIAQFRAEIGLPEAIAGHGPVTWMPTQVAGQRAARAAAEAATTRLQPDVELPTAAPASAAAAEAGAAADFAFTVRPGAFDARTTTTPHAPTPSPAAGGRQPALLFLVGLVVTGALGVGGYWLLRPDPSAAEVATTPAATSAPEATPAPAPTAEARTPQITAQSPTQTTTQAPEPTAAAPQAPGHDADEDFRRIVAAQTPDHEVEVTLVRTTLRSEKDGLEFTVNSRRDGYLYVFNRGSDGALLQLYPNRISGLPRVQAGKPLDLPDAKVEFKIAGASGPNQLLVMVSTLRRDHSALPSRDEGGFLFYPTGGAAAALSARLGGPLPWIAGTPECPAGKPCNDSFGATITTFNVVQ